MTLRALYLERTAAGKTRATLRDLGEVERPQVASDTVTIDVAYSTLNYKDALAITGISPIVRRFPMVAGIDFAGRVIESRDDRWRSGDEVVLTGWHASETHWGGLAQRAWIPAHWLIRKPSTLTLWETMAMALPDSRLRCACGRLSGTVSPPDLATCSSPARQAVLAAWRSCSWQQPGSASWLRPASTITATTCVALVRPRSSIDPL